MKFGISTFVTDEGIAPGVLARAIEERGFDSLFIAEHTHIPLSRKSPWPRGGELPRKYYRTLDPFITLTAAAAATERLLLGTGVALVVERDPIITAKEVASLDLVSGGRVLFGVGVGWNREEMENHGTDPRTRGKLTDERIRAMMEIWTKEEPEFHGRYVASTRSVPGPSRCRSPTRPSTSAADARPSGGSRSSATPGSQTGSRRTS
jgi:probable F420-dependent oxidoreductase